MGMDTGNPKKLVQEKNISISNIQKINGKNIQRKYIKFNKKNIFIPNEIIEIIISYISGIEIIKYMLFLKGSYIMHPYRCIISKFKITGEDLGGHIESYEMKYISKLTDIKYLDLKGINLNYIGLRYVSQMTNLEYLRLNTCHKGLMLLTKLTNLENLNLEQNNTFQKFTNLLLYLTNLKILNLSNTNLDTLNDIQYLTKLRELNLSGNLITDYNLIHLSHLTNLEHLDFTKCQLITTFQNLSQLTKLTSIIADYCSIDNSGLESLSKFPNLISLSLSKSKYMMTHLTDVNLKSLKLLKDLKYIDLTSYYSLGSELEYFTESVTHLNLSNCISICDNDLKKLSQLSNLKMLYLSHCIKITDIGLKYLPINNLEILKIDGCHNITKNSLNFLFSKHHMKVLEFSLTNKITISDVNLNNIFNHNITHFTNSHIRINYS